MGSLSRAIRVEMLIFFINKNFTSVLSLTAKVLRLLTRLLLTFSGTITLLIIELYHLMKPLIKKFLLLIACRVKTRFVLKRCSANVLTCDFYGILDTFFLFKLLLSCYYKKIIAQNRMTNRFEYGIQIRSIHADFSFTQKNIASKKQVENNILNVAVVVKPFFVRKCDVSCSFALHKLRRKCNGIFSAYFLTDSFVKTKMLFREFSSSVEIDSERYERSILEDLKSKAINEYVQKAQNQILDCKGEQRLEFIAFQVNDSKSSSYSQVGYSDLTLTTLSKLPSSKIVMVETPKANGGKRSPGINMPVDKVLQRMFLNFLGVLIEEDLKPEVFLLIVKDDTPEWRLLVFMPN
jgi:hypothetical protein